MGGPIESVLFDMDGVLYNYDRPQRLSLLSDALGVPVDDIAAKVFDAGLEDDHDLGTLELDAYIAEIGRVLAVPVTLRQWRAARKWAMSPEGPMLQLAAKLGEQVDIALMTNNGTFVAEALDELAPELRTVFGERMHFSGVLRAGKQHAATFPVLMDRLGWRAGTTLFIDDNPSYIAAADAAGLVTHLFDGIDPLRARLTALGFEV